MIQTMDSIGWGCVVVLLIAGFNCGLIGLFNIDLVHAIFGNILGRLIYVCFGVAAGYLIYMKYAAKKPLA